MLFAIIIILIILWFLGYSPITTVNVPNIMLFTINGHNITLWEILILIVVGWAIGILPKRFQLIAVILLVLWILSILGILAISGLSNMLVIVIIVGLILSIFIK